MSTSIWRMNPYETKDVYRLYQLQSDDAARCILTSFAYAETWNERYVEAISAITKTDRNRMRIEKGKKFSQKKFFTFSYSFAKERVLQS